MGNLFIFVNQGEISLDYEHLTNEENTPWYINFQLEGKQLYRDLLIS